MLGVHLGIRLLPFSWCYLRCEVGACRCGMRSVRLFPELGGCLSSHLRGRCLSSRYDVGAFHPGVMSVPVVPPVRSVSFVRVCGGCYSSVIHLVPFP